MGGYTELRDSYGYVSSRVATEQGVGTIQCPWRIEALPGQSISITVITLGDSAKQHNCHTLWYVCKLDCQTRITGHQKYEKYRNES